MLDDVESQDLVVRSFRSGDEYQILSLFERSFQVRRREDHWRWKFQQNPYGRERISEAFLGSRLVGHYAAYPIRFWFYGSVIETHHVGDTMTDVGVRHIGRGPSSVLGRTARYFYDQWCIGHIAFNFGFNVANIQKFSMRFLGSDLVEPVPYRVRDLKASPMRPMGRMERKLAGWTFTLEREVTDEWDALFKRVAGHYRFLSVRDARYLRWRYLQCPDIEYAVVSIRKWGHLVGWVVFRVREQSFVIGDLLLDPVIDGTLDAALRTLVPMYEVERLEAWLPERFSWLATTLRDTGLELRPEPQGLGLMCVPFDLPDATRRMRESLYYTMGDSDLF